MKVARIGAPLLGVATLVGIGALVELLIRAGAINRFVVPLPSQVLAAIPRIVAEESVPHRFWQTTLEAWWASATCATAALRAVKIQPASQLVPRAQYRLSSSISRNGDRITNRSPTHPECPLPMTVFRQLDSRCPIRLLTI